MTIIHRSPPPPFDNDQEKPKSDGTIFYLEHAKDAEKIMQKDDGWDGNPVEWGSDQVQDQIQEILVNVLVGTLHSLLQTVTTEFGPNGAHSGLQLHIDNENFVQLVGALENLGFESRARTKEIVAALTDPYRPIDGSAAYTNLLDGRRVFLNKHEVRLSSVADTQGRYDFIWADTVAQIHPTQLLAGWWTVKREKKTS